MHNFMLHAHFMYNSIIATKGVYLYTKCHSYLSHGCNLLVSTLIHDFFEFHFADLWKCLENFQFSEHFNKHSPVSNIRTSTNIYVHLHPDAIIVFILMNFFYWTWTLNSPFEFFFFCFWTNNIRLSLFLQQLLTLSKNTYHSCQTIYTCLHCRLQREK